MYQCPECGSHVLEVRASVTVHVEYHKQTGELIRSEIDNSTLEWDPVHWFRCSYCGYNEQGLAFATFMPVKED